VPLINSHCDLESRAEDRLHESPDPEPAITTLCVPTCNRVEGLKSSLSSYLQNFSDFGRVCDVLVSDDSAKPVVRRACRQMLLGLKRKFGVRIFYAGREEKLLYARQLIQQGGRGDSVKFALFETEKFGLGSYGANRNAILLHTVGEMLMMVDDDTFCRVVESPVRKSAFSVFPPAPHSSTFPCNVWVYENREELLSALRFVPQDFLGLHEKLLGRNAHQCGATWSDPITSCGTAVDSRNRVIVTFNGVAGDCAWHSPSGYLFLDQESLGRLLQSPESYASACISREVLRVVANHGIAKTSANSPGLFTGLDNRDLLPPYLPIGRGEDIIYWNTLSATQPHAFFGYLPWALVHLPVEKRKFWPGEILRSSSGVGLDLLVSSLVRSYKTDAGSAGANLLRLGDHLCSLGELPLEEFATVGNQLIGVDADSFIHHLEWIEAANPNGPPNWRADIRQFILNSKQTFSHRERLVPLDLAYSRSPEAAMEATRGLMLRFGHLLRHWLEIVRAAAALRAQGQRPGQEI
jgi:hypothetical protein